MAVLHLILLVFALVCFVLAASMFPPTQPYHSRLLAAGLAFLTASMIPWPQ